MRINQAAAGLIFLVALCAPGYSQNDECTTALAVPAGFTPFDTTQATTSPEPWPCAGGGGNDLWYTYTPAASGQTLTIETCGSTYDTALELFTGSCGGLVPAGCNDDSCGLQSSLTFSPTTSGVTVIFRVGGFAGASGAGIITVSETSSAPPNDECSAPILLAPGMVQPFDTTTATASAPAPMCGAGAGPDLWYSFTSMTTGDVTIESCDSNFDTVIDIFFGPCNALACITCWDDQCCERAIGRINSPTVGTEYFVRVSGSGGAFGTGSLIVYQKTSISEEVWGVNLATNRVYKSETSAFGASYLPFLSPEPRSFFGLDFDANATTLYAINGDTGEIHSIDSLGVVSQPFPSDLPDPGGPPFLDGLTAGPNGLWYAIQFDGTRSRLFIGSVVTGLFSAAPHAVTTEPNTIIDIAMDSQGNLYGTSITDQRLYSIDPVTGMGEPIGLLGLPGGYALNFAQGMDFDWWTDTLFATLYTGSCDGFFATINTSTGKATLLEPTLTSTLMQLGEFEMAIKVPIGNQCLGLLDDGFEDNDSCASAASIGAGSFVGLTCALTDADFYSITLQPGELLEVELIDNANTDLNLNRYNAACGLTASFNADSLAYLNTSTSAELVVFEVFVNPASAGVGCLGYDMHVAVTNGVLCGTPDGFEDSDDCSSALALGDGLYTGLNVEEADNDYYEVGLAAGGTIVVDLFFVDAMGDIDLYLWDPSMACDTNVVGQGTGTGALAVGFSASNDEQVVYTNMSGALQTLVVEVDMFDPASCNSYDLLINGTSVSPGIGTNYCQANPNSTGSVGLMSALGSPVAADNNVQLIASGLPANSSGFFIVSQTQGFVPNPNGSAGNLCVAGAIGRYVAPGQVQNTGATDSFSLALDLTMTPQPMSTVTVMAGDRWSYQAWHRDVIGGTATSNFTDGLQIDYQ